MITAQNTGRSRRLAGVRTLAALPVAVHLALFGASIHRDGGIVFGRLDFLVFIATITSVALVAFLWRDLRRLGLLAMLFWATLMPLVAVETVLARANRLGPAPWSPGIVRDLTIEVDLPGVRDRATLTTNSLGLRGPEFTAADLAASKNTILCVGGSTTECFYLGDEATWPWQLGELLSRDLGEPVFVGNAGRGGHIALHHAYQLRHYRHAKDFAFVVVLCGWNDVSTFLHGDFEKRAAAVPGEALVDGPGHRPAPRPHSAYYRSTHGWALLEAVLFRQRSAPNSSPQSRHAVQDPYGRWMVERREHRARILESHPIEEIPEGLDQALDRYRTHLRQIVASVRPGQKLVLMTQPTLFSADIADELESLTWAVGEESAYTAGVLERVNEAFNQVLREVASEAGAVCVDLAALLPKDTSVFYDDCHFNEGGCRQIAEIVAAALVGEMR